MDTKCGFFEINNIEEMKKTTFPRTIVETKRDEHSRLCTTPTQIHQSKFYLSGANLQLSKPRLAKPKVILML
jgi:hypothetical protein